MNNNKRNNLVFVTEARFFKDNDGNYYGDAAFSDSLWDKYLSHFDKIFVLARVGDSFGEDKIRINNSRVFFIDLPYFVGPVEYIKKIVSIKTRVREIVLSNRDKVFLCRIPGNISDLVISELKKNKIKYSLEVVGDPSEVFAKGNFNHPLRGLIKYFSTRNMKRNVLGASNVLYVTNETLQKKYPISKNASEIGVSDVIIPANPDRFIPKKSIQKKKQIISVGSLEQMYKSPDIVLKALSLLKQKSSLDFNFIWLGGGKYEQQMINMAQELGLDDVSFLGNVNRNKVDEMLKDSDLFILASRTEGMPRALIEAMSFGLPCIATKVGGIPELLSENVLVSKNSHEELAEKIANILINDEFYEKESENNVGKALFYEESYLTEKRNVFLNKLME
jgi:glycosyltransferase involved in cell wall biosynthesis